MCPSSEFRVVSTVEVESEKGFRSLESAAGDRGFSRSRRNNAQTTREPLYEMLWRISKVREWRRDVDVLVWSLLEMYTLRQD